MAFFDSNDDDLLDKMRDTFGPSQIDKQVRQAIHFCWMSLPKDKRNVNELERQIWRLVNRALRDLRNDFDEFFSDHEP